LASLSLSWLVEQMAADEVSPVLLDSLVAAQRAARRTALGPKVAKKRPSDAEGFAHER